MALKGLLDPDNYSISNKRETAGDNFKNRRKLRTASQRTSSLRLGPKVGLEFTVEESSISDNVSAVEGTEMTVIRTFRKLRSRVAVPPQAGWLPGSSTLGLGFSWQACVIKTCHSLVFIP